MSFLLFQFPPWIKTSFAVHTSILFFTRTGCATVITRSLYFLPEFFAGFSPFQPFGMVCWWRLTKLKRHIEISKFNRFLFSHFSSPSRFTHRAFNTVLVWFLSHPTHMLTEAKFFSWTIYLHTSARLIINRIIFRPLDYRTQSDRLIYIK